MPEPEQDTAEKSVDDWALELLEGSRNTRSGSGRACEIAHIPWRLLSVLKRCDATLGLALRRAWTSRSRNRNQMVHQNAAYSLKVPFVI